MRVSPGAVRAASWRVEVAEDPLGVIVLPGLAGLVGGVLLVEADEQVGQLAADGLDTEQRGQFGEVDQPVRIPAGPVVVGAVDNPEDPVVGLACLVQQAADLTCGGCHPGLLALSAGLPCPACWNLPARTNADQDVPGYPRSASASSRIGAQVAGSAAARRQAGTR